MGRWREGVGIIFGGEKSSIQMGYIYIVHVPWTLIVLIVFHLLICMVDMMVIIILFLYQCICL